MTELPSNMLGGFNQTALAGLKLYGPSEVMRLRKAGKLDEAFAKAEDRLKLEPDSLWAKRDFGWVLYSYLKLNADSEHVDTFIDYLHQLVELQLPADEVMLCDQVGWQIGKVIFRLLGNDSSDLARVKLIFNYAQHLHFTTRSEVYSFLFKAFHKAFKEQANYLAFANWWGLENFRNEDFHKDKLPNGKEIISIAEQGIIAYAKHLLSEQSIATGQTLEKQKSDSFMKFLDQVIATRHELQYPPYFKAKLLLASGDNSNILSALLPFAKKKRNEFWVWDVMSEAFVSEENKKITCYCKALTCSASDDFLIRIRQKLASWFIINNMYEEAKCEVENIIKTREASDWKIPSEIKLWTAENWYKTTKAKSSNLEFYKKHLHIADEILFSDVPTTTVFVDFVNTDKKIASFITINEKTGFFKYERFISALMVGDVLKVRFDGNGTEGQYRVLTLEKTEDDNIRQHYMKSIDGEVRITEGKSFGFLQDAFIHPTLVRKYKLKNGQRIQGKKIRSFDREKKQWGWRVNTIL